MKKEDKEALQKAWKKWQRDMDDELEMPRGRALVRWFQERENNNDGKGTKTNKNADGDL